MTRLLAGHRLRIEQYSSSAVLSFKLFAQNWQKMQVDCKCEHLEYPSSVLAGYCPTVVGHLDYQSE